MGEPAAAGVDLRDLAVVLGPAPPDLPGAAALTGPTWRTRPRVPGGATTVLWGSAPFPSGGSLPGVAAAAARRQAAVLRLRAHPPPGLTVRAVHAVSPAALSTGLRARVRARLLQGVLVELARDPAGPRVLDLVAAAAGATAQVSALSVGSGGTVLARIRVGGRPAVLRAAVQGAPGDPAAGVAPLRALHHPAVPRLIGSGVLAGVSWTAEELLPGRRPVRLDEPLLADVAAFCAALPRNGAAASAADDLVALARALPHHARRLDEVAATVDGPLSALPSVARHGDLWSGNLLAEGGRLCAVLDWDAWTVRAVPGTDLLHLVTTQQRLAGRRALGDVFLERPWRLPSYEALTSGYWAALGARPGRDALDAVGIAWWAAQVGADLRRNPHLAQDLRWTGANVDQVLLELASQP